MFTRIKLYLAIVVLFALAILALAGVKETDAPVPFETATVHFEQNATDGDVEVVFEAKGGDQGLAQLTVLAPDGRTVVDFKAPDPPTMGIRSFRFESPEPTDIQGLKAAYPAGAYRFTGATSDGQTFNSESALNHELPATISFVQPAPEAEGVSVEALEIKWTAIEGLAACLITLEQEDMGLNVSAKLPGTATTFAVPEGFLLPGKEYKIAIGTVTDEGNTSFVETSFTTAESE
jgi:hypothetical protein